MADAPERVQLYVDAANIRAHLKRLGIDPWFGPRELTRPFGNLLMDGKTLTVWRVIFYDAIDEQASTAKQQESYLESLRQLPNTLVRLGTVRGTRNRRQKGVDMRLGTDMVEAARSGFINYIGLASGDADYIPALQQVQDLGPKVLVLAFKSSLSQDLAGEADSVIPLPENRDRSWGIG